MPLPKIVLIWPLRNFPLVPNFQLQKCNLPKSGHWERLEVLLAIVWTKLSGKLTMPPRGQGQSARVRKPPGETYSEEGE